MQRFAISEIARVFGLRSSTIRYYEQIGILPPAQRTNGQRRYDESVMRRLALIKQAQQLGFTLEEIKQLFFGFLPGTSPSKRWQELSARKLAELDAWIQRIRTMQYLLENTQRCRCDSLDECGGILLEQGFSPVTLKRSLATRTQRRKILPARD